MVLMLGIFRYLFCHGLRGVEIKSRIWKTKNLFTDVDDSTDIYIFFWPLEGTYIKIRKRTLPLTERIGLGADSLNTQKTTSEGLQGEGSEDPPVKI